jgi:hypothetical protein
MKRMALCLALGLATAGAAAQNVWRCEVGGQVRYSDKPCVDAGQPVPERALQPNVADGVRPQRSRAAPAVRAEPEPAPAAAAPAGNVCPGDGELRGMRTRASSTTLGDAERRFLQDEVRRVQQCRAGQGRYTDGDWAVSREAQAAQTQISERVREQARERAEAMHAAADPLEGERIARRRLAEERLQQRLRAGQNAPLLPN